MYRQNRAILHYDAAISRQVDECHVVDVATILSSKKDKDSVSLHLYLTIEERPVVPTLLKYSSRIVNKKEVTGNDSTGVIKVTLW